MDESTISTGREVLERAERLQKDIALLEAAPVDDWRRLNWQSWNTATPHLPEKLLQSVVSTGIETLLGTKRKELAALQWPGTGPPAIPDPRDAVQTPDGTEEDPARAAEPQSVVPPKELNLPGMKATIE